MAKICPICHKQYSNDMSFCSDDGGVLYNASPGEPHHELINQTLEGRWDIKRKLGEGSMGAVYLASQRSVQRTVAVKTLH